MSFPTLADDHEVTKAVDQVFEQFNVSREGQPSHRPVEDTRFGEDQERVVVTHNNGESAVPDGIHETDYGVVFIEESADDLVRAVVDTEAEVADEHPASY